MSTSTDKQKVAVLTTSGAMWAGTRTQFYDDTTVVLNDAVNIVGTSVREKFASIATTGVFSQTGALPTKVPQVMVRSVEAIVGMSEGSFERLMFLVNRRNAPNE